MLRNNKGQWAIVEILVAVAIMATAAYFIYPKYLTGNNGSGGKQAAAPSPEQRAQGVGCINNLNQVKQSITMYQASNDRLPSSLEEAGVDKSILKCPVSGTPYKYDPQSGKVSCTTPGHEKY